MIFALHGFSGSGLDFEPLFHAGKARYTWTAPDMPGHGSLSGLRDATAYTQEAFARQMDNLLPRGSVLLGYSMGGRMALHYAVTRPDAISALILISANPGNEDKAEREARKKNDTALADRILRIGAEAFLYEWEKHPLIASQKHIPAAIRNPMLDRRKQNTPQGLALSLLHMGTGSMLPLWDKLDSITCPTLLVTGENDAAYCSVAKRMLPLMGNATHTIIPDAGHMTHLENLPAFLNSLTSFL